MVIWNEVSFPCLQKLFLQTIDHVSWNTSALGALTITSLIEAPASTESLACSTCSLSSRRAASTSWCFSLSTSGRISTNATAVSLWPWIRHAVDRLLLIVLGYSGLAAHWSLRLSTKILIDRSFRAWAYVVRPYSPGSHFSTTLLSARWLDPAEAFLVAWPIPGDHLIVVNIIWVARYLRPPISWWSLLRRRYCRFRHRVSNLLLLLRCVHFFTFNIQIIQNGF